MVFNATFNNISVISWQFIEEEQVQQNLRIYAKKGRKVTT